MLCDVVLYSILYCGVYSCDIQCGVVVVSEGSNVVYCVMCYVM